MSKNRLEAFSDGVVAIIITIMVLELRAPEEPTLAALRPLAPIFLSYALGFIYVGVFWNNHHHLLQATHNINGAVLWANLAFLFSLSLIPFATAWIGTTLFAPLPLALFGVVMLAASVSYIILATVIIRLNGPDSPVAQAAGPNLKGYISLGLQIAAVALAFVNPYISSTLYVLVALVWIVPDRRLERTIQS